MTAFTLPSIFPFQKTGHKRQNEVSNAPSYYWDRAGGEKGLFDTLQSLCDSHFLAGGIDYLGNGCLGIHLSVIMEGRDIQATKAALEVTIPPLSCTFLIPINKERFQNVIV